MTRLYTVNEDRIWDILRAGNLSNKPFGPYFASYWLTDEEANELNRKVPDAVKLFEQA